MTVNKMNAVLALLCGAVVLTVGFGVVDRRCTATPPAQRVSVLIDPGHGGADGGAVAPDGTLEKTLNLSVSLTLRDLLRVMGFSVTMTRDTDTMVNAEGDTQRERKVRDMNNRLAMSQQADFTVSIHQNTFSQSQYHGTQVFYSANRAESRVLAEAVQESVVTALQPENNRVCKAGSSSVFLLDRAQTPLILVECGFLSNETELAKLKDPLYQRQLALAVAGGVLKGR